IVHVAQKLHDSVRRQQTLAAESRAVHEVPRVGVDADLGEERLHFVQTSGEATFIAPRFAGGAQRELGVEILADLVGDAQIVEQRRGAAPREFDALRFGPRRVIGILMARPYAAHDFDAARFERDLQRACGVLGRVLDADRHVLPAIAQRDCAPKLSVAAAGDAFETDAPLAADRDRAYAVVDAVELD